MDDHMRASSARSRRRERYHHGDLRRDLLRVARDEIAANGAEAMTLTSLARLAGVGQSAPYRHFADRRTLLEALAAEGFADLTAALRDALATLAPSMQPRDALAAAYVGFGEANVELYRLMFASRLTPTSPDDSPLDVAAAEAFILLRTTIAAESVEGSADDRAVYRAWAMMHGLVMLKADGFIGRPLKQFT